MCFKRRNLDSVDGRETIRKQQHRSKHYVAFSAEIIRRIVADGMHDFKSESMNIEQTVLTTFAPRLVTRADNS